MKVWIKYLVYLLVAYCFEFFGLYIDYNIYLLSIIVLELFKINNRNEI